jgi:hypothetical protein
MPQISQNFLGTVNLLSNMFHNSPFIFYPELPMQLILQQSMPTGLTHRNLVAHLCMNISCQFSALPYTYQQAL